MAPALTLEQVSYRYANTQRLALDDVSLEVPAGQFLLICGPSGGGKSTLLRCCLGLVPRFFGGDFSGEVFVQGQSIARREPRDVARILGMVFQNPEDQVVATKVMADVAFGPENLGLNRDELQRRTAEALALARIQPLAEASMRRLSAGQLQKVALAGVLALSPNILGLDEPTSQIDSVSAREFIRLTASLAHEHGKTIVLSEHHLDFAAPLADRLVVLAGGRIVADGKPREVLAKPQAVDWGLTLPRSFELALRLKELGRWQRPLPLSESDFMAGVSGI